MTEPETRSQREASTRCTYCRAVKPKSAFDSDGDHVVPASLGGSWVDGMVCPECNERANAVADELIGKDFLVRFLRALYGVPDRYGKRPGPPVFALPLGGGVIKATLHESGPTFEVQAGPSRFDALGLDDIDDQTRLRRIFDEALGGELPARERESLAIAQLAQQVATPRDAWSRFMAKLGLACGRDAYGDAWLDSRQARTMSRDLLSDHPPKFSQRTHHPPVERTWPFEPPKHQLWIEPHKDTAVLMVALFGQVLGAVPVNDLPAEGDPSAWSFDPRARTFYRSTYPAVWFGNAARRIQEAGGTPYMIGDPQHPFIYTPDGPDGPVDLGVSTIRVDSLEEAFQAVRRRGDVAGRP